MSMIVVINGNPFLGWTKASAQIDFGKASNEATVTLTEQPSNPFPAKLNDTASVIVDGRPIVTGFVDDVSGRHSWETHEIDITIRDKTQDLVDSTIGPKQEYIPPKTLKEIATGTLEKMGLSGIKVIDNVNPEAFRPAELVGGAIDTYGHDFLNAWAMKRQVVLNTDGKGNLVIDRNQRRRGPGALIKFFEDSPTNNVLEANYSNTSQKRANKHSAAGQKSQADKKHWEAQAKGVAEGQANPMSTNVGEAYDNAMRPTRRIYYRGRQAIEGETPKAAAAWKANLARADGVKYEATVQGFSAGGSLWWPGFIIPVMDAHFLLATDMFIKSVTFEKTWDGGETTRVSCTVEDAYTKDASEQPKSGERGGGRGIGHSPPGRFTGGLEF